MTQASTQAGVGVIKFSDVGQYTDYQHYKQAHPEAKIGNFIPIKNVKLGYDPTVRPTTEKGWEERRQQFKKAKADWMSQISDQLNKLDKTKPLVLHMGNHGLNPRDNLKPGEATFMCMYGLHASSSGECISYEESG